MRKAKPYKQLAELQLQTYPALLQLLQKEGGQTGQEGRLQGWELLVDDLRQKPSLQLHNEVGKSQPSHGRQPEAETHQPDRLEVAPLK